MAEAKSLPGEAVVRKLFGDAYFESSRVEAPWSYRRELLGLADVCIFDNFYTRDGLELHQRSLCTIAALTVLGRLEQLRQHVAAAINIGIPERTVAEVIMQMACYGGFPCALNAMTAAEETFAAVKGGQ